MESQNWTAANQERKQKRIIGETGRAKERRLREGYFKKYINDRIGLDIGAGEDPINNTYRRWDLIFGDGDATELEGVEPETFETVYASHVLEHLQFPHLALKRWYEVLKPNGYLCISIPHRDLYEKKKFLPSQWNPDHKYFWLPEDTDPPFTKSLRAVTLEAIPNANILEFRVVDEGYDYNQAGNEHPVGEYSIEMVIQKPENQLEYEI